MSTYYRVQVGAFVLKRNAEKLAAKIIEQFGIRTVIVEENMLYKVQAGSFASKINALNRAALLDKAGYKTIVSMHVVEDSAPVDDKKTDKEPHRVRVWAINFMDEDESQYGDATVIIE